MTEREAEHKHYWVVGPAVGNVKHAVCRDCGSQRDFSCAELGSSIKGNWLPAEDDPFFGLTLKFAERAIGKDTRE